MTQISRLLRHERIRMEMETQPLTDEEREELGPRAVRVKKERILGEIAGFLAATGRVGNERKLLADLIHRERKACTAVGGGLAIPHVRTPSAKEPIAAFLRSTPGLEFDAPDGEPVHVFLALVAPPWDDRLYLKVYRELGELFRNEAVLPWLLEAESVNDVFNFFRAPERYLALER